MSARALDLLPTGLAAEMARLHAAGFSLLPLGRGADGKAPLLGFAGTERLPLRRVLAPMHRLGSTCYGIRLAGLVVVDCDADDEDLVSAMEARFGASPVHVSTPRGRHLYYRAPGPDPDLRLGSDAPRPVWPNLRAEGLAVDPKRSATAYVMGPGSVRPDGGAYVPAKGLLGRDALPVIRLRSAAVTGESGVPSLRPSERIPMGERHVMLAKAAVDRARSATGPDNLVDALRAIRDRDCEAPESVPHEEVRSLAEWDWRCRLEGRLYTGRTSEVRVSRQALDLLRGAPNASDATALYVQLVDVHGHRSGYAFVLDHEAMLAAGVTDLTRRRFRAARDTLLGCQLLQIAGRHVAGRRARTYHVSRPLPTSANLTPLHTGGEKRRRV